MDKSNQSKGYNYKENYLLIKSSNYHMKKKKKGYNILKYKNILLSTTMICLLLIFYLKIVSYSSKHIINNITNKIYNDPDFNKYKIMIPHLTPDLNE